MKVNKKTVFHGSLLCICILCITFIYYWRQQTLYIYPNEEVYINDISENKIFVRGLPYETGIWEGEYVIQIDNTLLIKDSKGEIIDMHSLKRGDILIFEYSGSRNHKFPNGTILNGEKINASNFRLSEKKLNLKFWKVE